MRSNLNPLFENNQTITRTKRNARQFGYRYWKFGNKNNDSENGVYHIYRTVKDKDGNSKIKRIKKEIKKSEDSNSKTKDNKKNLKESFVGWHAAGGISAWILRFLKLKQAKQLFLSEYPTPQDLQRKLEPIMDRNPKARMIYTKLEGMDQFKYEFFISKDLLKSYSAIRILGNYLLSPIAMAYQGMDMAANEWLRSPGDFINRAINDEDDLPKMYYNKWVHYKGNKE